MKKFRDRVSQNFPFNLSLPRDVENAYFAYTTSFETDNLESEEKRRIYGELIDCEWGKDWNRRYDKISKEASARLSPVEKTTAVDDDDDDGNMQATQAIDESKWWRKIEFGKGNQPNSLRAMSLEVHARKFEGGKTDGRIVCQDATEFGYLADTDLPLSQSLLEFDNEIYWKRVVSSKIKDTVKLQKLFRSNNVDWKRTSVELTYVDFCQKFKPSQHQFEATHEEIRDFTKLCRKNIQELKLHGIQPERRELQNEFNPDIKTVNYKPEECSHFPLDFLGQVSDMKKLSLSLKPVPLNGFDYERRFFNVATEDIRHLANGLQGLSKLRTLAITQTNLEEDPKLAHLLTSLKNIKTLRNLALTHCSIKSANTGGHFSLFLAEHSAIEKLDLSYNDLDREFCQHFASGLEKFLGKLHYLGLSMTGIFYNGLDSIVKSIAKRDNVCVLNVSCCEGVIFDRDNTVIDELENLVKCSHKLRVLNMTNNEITEESRRRQIIDGLTANFSMKTLNCFNCGFAASEEVSIKVLLARNNYYRENPVLKKERFSREDEIEIEQWLRRVKHPLLLKHKKDFLPTENVIKWENKATTMLYKEPIENYKNYCIVNK